MHSGKKAKTVVAVINSLIRTPSLLIAKLVFTEFTDSQIRHFNYHPQQSCGKVMFSQASVILFTWILCPSMHHRSHDQGGLCPGGSLSMGVSVQGSLSRGVSVQGVSVQESLSRGVSVQEESLSKGGLCLGVSVQGVSVHGVLCPGFSVQESLSRGVYVWGSLSGGLCPGGSLSGGSLLGRHPYGNERVVCWNSIFFAVQTSNYQIADTTKNPNIHELFIT